MKSKVALFVNGWNGENVDNFIEGFNGCFTNDEVDLFVFTSYSTNVNSMEEHDAEDSIYSLPNMSFFDAVIIYGAGIKSESAITDIIRRCKEADVPVILQGVDSDEVTSVTVDNYIGMKVLCKHLIEKHAVKNVTYIAGAADNPDSIFRMEVLKESLLEHGYSFGEENIFYANWESLQIKSFLNGKYADGKLKLPDAFVCANDQMAMVVVLFLEQMGYKVPDDVIVTGFDNLSEGKLCYPSLATVDQSYKGQGAECAKLAIELIHNKKLIKKRIIPCAAVPGESCGCMDCNGEAEFRKNVGRMWRDERYISDSLKRAEFQFDKCFTTTVKYEDIHQCMNENFLASTGRETQDFHMYLNPQYRELKYMNTAAGEYQEICFSPVMDTICAKSDGIIYREDILDSKHLFLGYKGIGKGKTYIFTSAVVNSFVAGYMVINYVQGAFKRNEYFEFKESVNKTLVNHQKNIDNSNKSIRIQEQTEEFLKQTVKAYEEHTLQLKELFAQTAEALAVAIDAKDNYTHGHSVRVAEYSREMAKLAGKSEEECEEVYFAGLLHDVGKIGIADRIINKDGKLSDEEYAAIKKHPAKGKQILSSIDKLPYLSIGANSHHERYDGHGYPESMKGTDIPELARIIAVADAYDAMTSKRSYRDPLPQQKVREEILRGSGTQFDPVYAGLMIQMIDTDTEYQMREKVDVEGFSGNEDLYCAEYGKHFSEGLSITPFRVHMQFTSKKNDIDGGLPSIRIFDAMDGRVHHSERNRMYMHYIHYCDIRADGVVTEGDARKIEVSRTGEAVLPDGPLVRMDVDAVKWRDHMYVTVSNEHFSTHTIIALPDSTYYAYLAVTGEQCHVYDVNIEKDEKVCDPTDFKRIAEEISYIEGPEGDIPSIQINGWRFASSEAILMKDKLELSFHMKSLPSARLIWHLPFVVIYSADDKTIGGENYREFALIRFDGESWQGDPCASNRMIVNKKAEFLGWDEWKEGNRQGRDCKLTVLKNGNELTMTTECGGIELTNITTIQGEIPDLYFAFTGDQCVVENIRILS